MWPTNVLQHHPSQSICPMAKRSNPHMCCDIHIQGLPMVLVHHIVPSLTIASLIGVWPLCKAGCTVTFDNEKCDVIFGGKIILTGLKNPSMDSWRLPVPHGRMWTTPSLVTIGPYSARMMQSRQLGYATVTSTAMVPIRLSTCMMQDNLETAPTLPQPGPCIGRAPHPPEKASDIHPGIDIAAFTHLVQTRANTVNFAHQSLCNPKISTLLKATWRDFLKRCPNLNERLIVNYLNPSPALLAKGHMKCPRHGIKST
jgi:hypothetical protein